VLVVTGFCLPYAHADDQYSVSDSSSDHQLNNDLIHQLKQAGFTGKIQASLEKRLGRSINLDLALLGKNLFFDTVLSLGNDNNCSGCHSPLTGFSDSQSIAIGVENNGIVGAGRSGPRNQRRAPQVINAAYFPSLMWNARISSISHNAFDVSEGVRVPFFLGGTTVWKPDAPSIYGTLFDKDITKTLLGVHANFPGT
jgi:cytochrome c peroxidase